MTAPQPAKGHPAQSIHVYCGECGNQLQAFWKTGDVVYSDLVVDPCPTCMEKARELPTT